MQFGSVLKVNPKSDPAVLEKGKPNKTEKYSIFCGF
jgi:hypothetical protein